MVDLILIWLCYVFSVLLFLERIVEGISIVVLVFDD